MAFVLLAAFLIVIFALRVKPGHPLTGTAVMNLIPAPTDTLLVPTSTVTPTPEANHLLPPPGGAGITIGVLVQISGTGNDGLRIRTEPGLQGQVKFVGIEAEVFQVKDGPREIDGYTWWLLVAPYDETLNGWAVGDYLQLIQNP